MRLAHSGKKLLAACAVILTASTLVVVVRCSQTEFGVAPEVPTGGARDGQATTDTDRFIDIERRRGEGNLVPGNDVRLLIDGQQTYDAMFAAIDGARDHIHVESYIVQDDRTGRRLADALIARREAGVAVQFMYDGYGSTDSDEYWQRLRDAGVEVHEFNPPEPTENIHFTDYDRRDHRKILIVDGKVGFTGGINFYDAYASGSSRRKEGGQDSPFAWFGSSEGELSWRDTHVRIEGPAVADLQRIFTKLWEQEAGAIQGERLYPEIAAAGGDHVRFEAGVGGNDSPSETYEAYLDIFDEARERIWITQAYFVPNRAFIDAMVAASHRGVDVKIIVPGVTDVSFILYASRDMYGELLDAGVQIFEYQDAVLHAKTAVADGAWSIVGSSNLDSLSFIRNHEVDAIIVGRGFASEMERQFLVDLGHTRQITAGIWRKRPLGYKALGLVAGWFEPWM